MSHSLFKFLKILFLQYKSFTTFMKIIDPYSSSSDLLFIEKINKKKCSRIMPAKKLIKLNVIKKYNCFNF